MAGKGLGLLLLAAAALGLAGRKKKDEDAGLPTVKRGEGAPDEGGFPSAQPGYVPPRGAGEVAEGAPVPAPSNMWQMFQANYEDAVDRCWADSGGDMDPLVLRACALAEIFPQASWPPPQRAWQWQRNLWNDDDLASYIAGKYPPTL
jgi:hypothetical protein